MPATFIGIDVSKSRLDLCALPGGERTAGRPADLDRLVGWVRQRRPERVVLEATGGYEREAVAATASRRSDCEAAGGGAIARSAIPRSDVGNADSGGAPRSGRAATRR